jgi:uncharacterized repeat protein (TIGR01451 family)
MMRIVRNTSLGCLFCLALGNPAMAQLYGTSPFQNGPAPENGSLFRFNPDDGTWMSGSQVNLAGFTITGINSVTVHPKLSPPSADDGKIYAILKVAAVTGRVLATIDPTTGVTTQIGNLGDKFSSIAFRADGQLFGTTGNGATVPETLYLIDKATGATTLAAALGAGIDGEVIAFNPVDNFFYHWSGNGTVVFEKVMSVAPYTATNIPVIGTANGEIFGAVWDPCRQRPLNGGSSFQFIGSNLNSRFNYWDVGGTVSAQFGSNPDDIRGLALIGGYTCDVDVGIGISASNLVPNIGESVVLTIVVDNAGDARAIDPVVTITMPPSLTPGTTSGCLEDGAGVPTCTVRVSALRYDPTTMTDIPFVKANLFKNEMSTVTLNAVYNGGNTPITVSVSSGSNETVPADNSASLFFGDNLFKNGFEN